MHGGKRHPQSLAIYGVHRGARKIECIHSRARDLVIHVLIHTRGVAAVMEGILFRVAKWRARAR
eukprot:COSAG05_NODE_2091_length_3578_cov_2.905145_7_plen_64_part_00